MKKYLIAFVLLSVCGFAQSALDKAKELVAQRDFDAAEKEIKTALAQAPSKETYVLAGDIYSELDRADVAALNYEKAYKSDKDDNAVARKYALALSTKGDNTNAITIIKAAMKNDKNDVYSLLAYGDILTNADSTNAAELVLTKAREMNKKIPDGFIALGNMYYKQKVYELAKSNYEEALKLDEKNLVARERLASSYFYLANSETDNALANEQYNRSLQEWNTITKQDPKNARAFFEQGKIYFYAKKYGPAATNLAEYYRLRPDADNAKLSRWFLAQSYDKLRGAQPDEAQRIALSDSAEPHLTFVAQSIDTLKNTANSMLARNYFDSKKYSQSAQMFGSLVASQFELDADDNERYGRALLYSGDTTKGISFIKKAIELNPKKVRTASSLAETLRNAKKYTDAIEMYRFVSKNVDSLAPRMNALIGVCFFSNNQADSAIAPLQTALAGDSTLLFARRMLGSSYANLKKSSDAKREYLLLVESASKDVAKYKSEAEIGYGALCNMALQEEKNYNDLLKYANSWLKVNPESANAYLYAAVAYQGLQDKDNACKNYKEVLKRDKANAPAAKNLKSLGC